MITINLDDYEIAKEHFKTDVYLVKGVGIDPEKYDFKLSAKEKKDKRNELGISTNDFVMIYPAEILPRKRQMWLINSVFYYISMFCVTVS